MLKETENNWLFHGFAKLNEGMLLYFSALDPLASG